MPNKPVYFDSTIEVFTNRPDLRSLGFAQVTLITAWGLHGRIGNTYDFTRLNLDTCRTVANYPGWWDSRKSDAIVLDEEHMPMHTDDLVARDVVHDQLIEAVRVYRLAHPGVAIGYYAKMPELDFYSSLKRKFPNGGWGDQSAAQAWLEHNRQFVENVNNRNLTYHRRGLLSQVDRVYPSVYQHWTNGDVMDPFEVWKVVHDGNVEQAEQYQKPIMPYLSPKLHGGGEYLPAGTWQKMLEHSLDHPSVDGVVIFQGTNVTTEWDESATWWIETKQAIGF